MLISLMLILSRLASPLAIFLVGGSLALAGRASEYAMVVALWTLAQITSIGLERGASQQAMAIAVSGHAQAQRYAYEQWLQTTLVSLAGLVVTAFGVLLPSAALTSVGTVAILAGGTAGLRVTAEVLRLTHGSIAAALYGYILWSPVLPVSLLLWPHLPVQTALGLAGLAAIACGVRILMLVGRGEASQLERQPARETAAFAANAIASAAIKQADILLAAALLNEDLASQYAAANRVVALLYVAVSTITIAVVVQMRNYLNSGTLDQLRVFFGQVATVQFILAGLFLILLASGAALIAPLEFFLIVVTLSLGAALAASVGPAGILLAMMGEAYWIARVNVLCLALVLVSGLAATHYFGGLALAATFAVGVAAQNLIVGYRLHQKLPFRLTSPRSWPDAWRQVHAAYR